MTAITFTSVKKGMGLLIPFSLLILFVTGCASLQEMRAKKGLERAGAAYAQAKANPNVDTYAPALLADAGKILQAAEQTKDYAEMEQMSYLVEKKVQTALTIAEGKKIEKEAEALSKEAADLLLQKRVLEANLAKREAEQSRLAAKGEAATAEKAKREAEQSRSSALAEAERAERLKREAEARAREAEQARMRAVEEAERAERSKREAEARAREAEQARMRAVEEAERAEKTKAETDQLLKEFTELKAQQTERGIVLTMGDVLFAFGKSALLPGAIRNVQKVADFLQKNPTRNILIEGYTDSVGSDEFNLTLSQKRADAVKEQLVAMGIRSDRITTKGYGKQFPVASNESEGGRQLNRRVEVLILNEGVSPETVFRK
jgi:outer membrane protein OmpA-like peptidoglycan-associated protein